MGGSMSPHSIELPLIWTPDLGHWPPSYSLYIVVTVLLLNSFYCCQYPIHLWHNVLKVPLSITNSAGAGDIQIQPLVNHPGTSQGGPPPGEVPGGSNPYRIGTGIASRKPAFGASGIASFGSTPSSSGSSFGQSGQPAMMPPYQPPEIGAFQVRLLSNAPRRYSICYTVTIDFSADVVSCPL